LQREAGVTKQLVYHYYGSKEVLFSTVLDDASQQIMQELIAFGNRSSAAGTSIANTAQLLL